MAVWWCALVMVGVWAGGCEAVGRREWERCAPVVCAEVEKQAQSLARLKLLRNYVAQTMELLDSVVGSLDDEVVRSSHSLTEFIGSDCPSAHTYLDQVIQEYDDDLNQNLELLHVLEGSEASLSPYTTTSQSSTTHTSTSTSNRPSTTRQAEDISTEQHWSHQEESTTDFQNSIEDSILEVGQDLETSSPNNYLLTNIFDPTTNHRQDTAELPTPTRGYERGPYMAPTSPPWKTATAGGYGGSGSGYGGADLPGRGVGQGESRRKNGRAFGALNSAHGSGSEVGGSDSGNRDSGFVNRTENTGSRLGTSESSSGHNVGVGCRGVERWSTHWVPGLDIWCARNCAVGYCPIAQCVC